MCGVESLLYTITTGGSIPTCTGANYAFASLSPSCSHTHTHTSTNTSTSSTSTSTSTSTSANTHIQVPAHTHPHYHTRASSSRSSTVDTTETYRALAASHIPPTKDCHNAPHQWRNRQAKSHSRHHDLRVCIQDAPLGPPSPPPLTSARPDESTGARITSLDDYKSCLDHFQSRGYNEIDTARVYVGGKQEAWTREAGWKDRGLMLATKWYPHTPYVEPGSVDQDNCSPSRRDI